MEGVEREEELQELAWICLDSTKCLDGVGKEDQEEDGHFPLEQLTCFDG